MNETERFKHILIIGVGLIGGSLALALKRKGFQGKILGIDDKSILKQAKERSLLDETYDRSDLSTAVKKADLIFLCTPISEIIHLIQTISKYVDSRTLVTDVGSTKRKIVETANIFLANHCEFIGGHPMAGSEISGLKAADPFLFENATYVLTPSRPIKEETRRAFGELLERIGAKVLLLLPKLHDEIAAAVSHLPQMASISMMHLAAKQQEESPYFLKMAAGGFRDMTRIASSPYEIWEDIISTNSDMILQYIDAYKDELDRLKDFVQSKKLEDYFDRAARHRLSIPKDTRGFLKPHYDISVAVEDKPGIIAHIASTLAEKNINIKDIEVLKIRENEGGTIRLAFSSETDREQAIRWLRSERFECRKRE